MFKSLRQNISILVVVISFLALNFAASAEAGQSSKKSAKPTPKPKKSAKATLTPNKKKAAKATPKKSPTAASKSKTVEKKVTGKKTAAAKSSAAKNTAKDKNPKSKDEKKAKDEKNLKTVSAKNSAASKSAKHSKPAARKKSAIAKTAMTRKSATPKTPIAAKATDFANSESAQVMVTDVSAQIRSQAKPNAPELSKVKLGTVLSVAEKTPLWYRVRFSNAGKSESGWIPVKSVDSLNAANKDQVYTQVVNRYYKPDEMDFATAAEIYEFLTANKADYASSNSASDLELKRLLALRSALKTIPASAKDAAPYKEFLKSHDKEIVYSEPSGKFLVTSNLFWDLHKKYKDAAISEQIAWEAAQNPLPGECEGYVNCHLFYARMTSGEYLNLHPTGKRNLEALTNLTNLLDPIVADLNNAKSVYTGPTDVTDRAEFNNLVAELRTIVSRLPLTEKEKPLQQLKKIAEGFR